MCRPTRTRKLRFCSIRVRTWRKKYIYEIDVTHRITDRKVLDFGFGFWRQITDNGRHSSVGYPTTDRTQNGLRGPTLLSGHFAPHRQTRKLTKRREFDRQLFMSDEKCRQGVVARVVSPLHQLAQPRHKSGMVALLFLMQSKKRYPPLYVAAADMNDASLPKPWPHSY